MTAPADGGAAATQLSDALARSGLTVSTSGNAATLSATFPYAPQSIEQVCRLQGLQERVAELEQALKREQDRSKLLESDLARLRLQHSWSLGGSGGSSGGSSPRRSPCRLASIEAASLGDTSPFAAAAAAATTALLDKPGGGHCASGAPPAGSVGDGAGEGMAAMAAALGLTPAPSCGGAASDTVVVSRAALELLYLKERAMDSAKEGIVIADCSQPDMPLIYANEGFSRMTGYSRESVLGRNCRFLQCPPPGASKPADSDLANDAPVHELRAAITAGLPCVVQLMNYRRNGDPFVNYLSLNPVYDEAGKLTHYVGVQSDITELVNHRKAELAAKHAALQAAAATEAKSQFLARMSHEIRTPLNGMIAVGQLLADTPLSPAQWDLVNTIRCSGETLLTLITDILDFSRIEANKMVLSSADFRLQTVIEAAMEIAGLHAAQKRLQVAYNIADSVPAIVVGDAQRLQQILLNILNNACKFTEQGEILLEVWVQEDEKEEEEEEEAEEEEGPDGTAAPSEPPLLQQQPQGSGAGDAPAGANGSANGSPNGGGGGGCQAPRPLLLRFSVRDTGIGISPENIDRLFQSFSQVDASPTRRHGGSGLGLAICQRLCQAMGGRMWAESAGMGEGSRFCWSIRVKLPSGTAGAAGGGSLGLTPPSSGRCSMDRADASSTRNSMDAGLLSLSGAAAGLAPAASSPLYALLGRRVLLVEPCPMVRHVLALALRRWGCAVCAVGSEAEGVAWLKMVGGDGAEGGGSGDDGGDADAGRAFSPSRPLSPGGGHAALESVPEQTEAAPAAAACRKRGRRRRWLQLQNSGPPCDAEFQHPGPYDVVIMDMQLQQLLQALMLWAHPGEAQRVVFMGWPGQNEPEDRGDGSSLYAGADSMHGSLPSLHPPAYSTLNGAASAVALGGLPGGLSAQPPRVLAEQLAAQGRDPGQRQLGYVVVTRPLRQGRLRLALEEVLSMQLSSSTAGGTNADGTAGGTAAVGGSGAHASSPAKGGGPAAPSGADPYSPAVLLGLGSDSDGADASSSLGSRASSSSNLRCAGATLVRANASGAHLADAAAAGTVTPLRLLLAEDNAINMKVALGILKRMGCSNVVTAEDGEAAVEAVHAAGGPEAFDVILMDLHMPRKGGMEAVRDIRRAWPQGFPCKIIAVTADAFEDTRDNCIANGFDGWLAKPFRVEEFARVLAACRSGAALTPKRP